MEKIGLITFHDTTNFGSFLQTYGLYKTLTDIGYDCSVIDYKCDAISKTELPSKKPSKITIREIIKFFLFEPIKRKKYRSFNNELDKKMKLTDIYSKKTVKKTNKDFDIFITGSDILWDFNLTKGDTTYFLDFAGSDKKKIAFGTSVGSKWNNDCLKIAKNLVNRYEHIALREEKSVEWLKEIVNKKIDSVCDPTMLVSSDYWKKYACESKFEKRLKNKQYILVYFPLDKILEDAKEYAKKNNLEVWVINYGLKIKGVKNIKPYEISDFLSLEKNAKLILTSSYHGTLFAIYFNVPFFSYLRDNEHNVRFESLANKLEIENRIRTGNSTSELDLNFDFDILNKKVDEWRIHSIELLKEYLI